MLESSQMCRDKKIWEGITVIEAYAWNVQRGPPPWLSYAPTSQVWGQWSIVWQSFNPVLRSNTDSEWSQKNDVTTAACRNNKEVPFRMGRSEVRLKPEGTSEFDEPQITHTETLITWHCWVNFSEDVNCNLGQCSKAFWAFISDCTIGCAH